MASPSLHSRIEASFLCLAVTDALGGPLEFGPRITNPSLHVTTMLQNENFDLAPGHFTDDTSMALCLATSLLESNGRPDAASQAERYLLWMRRGELSSVPGRCFDVGMQTVNSLSVWEDAMSRAKSGGEFSTAADTLKQIAWNFNHEVGCGNGSLMRVLPCALVAGSEELAVELARESSLVTHPHRRCVDSCIVYTRMVYRALRGATKQDLFQTLYEFMQGAESTSIDSTLRNWFKSYDSIENFDQKPLAEISSSGYVVHSLEAALWAFFTTDSYRDGAVKVVNLGNDADTVGAIYGGLAGAFYGSEAEIPKEWLDEMKELSLVRDVTARIVHTFHSGTSAS